MAIRLRVAALLLLSLAACCAFKTTVRTPGAVSERWKFATGGFVDCIPAVSGDTAWFGSWDHFLYAVDVRTGAMKWSADLGDFIDAPPLVSGDKLYACAWNRLVRCLDAADGRERWRFEMPSSAFDDHRQGGPVLSGGNILVGGFDGVLYALDRDTGEKRWALPTGAPIRGMAAPEGFVGSGDGVLYSFDPATGALRWRFAADGPIGGTPAVAGSRVFFACRSGRVFALDAASGAVAWRHDTGSRIEYSSPLVVEGLLHVGDCDGRLRAIRVADGGLAWEFPAGAPIYSTAVRVGRAIAFGDNAGGVHFLDRATGRELGVFRAGGAVQALSAAGDGSVLCGSRDGHVYRLALGGGES